MPIKTCILRTAHVPQAVWDTEDAVGFTLVASDPLSLAAPTDSSTGCQLIDPSTVTFSLRTPSGATETHVLGTSEDLVRESQGRYRLNRPVEESGVFAYRWAVGGDYQGVGESRLIVRRSPFTTPANSVAPVASGTPTVGQTLACTTGTWGRNPTSFAYQWLRDGSAISGATSATYVLISADFSHDVSCQVTATNASGDTAVTSNALTITGSGLPANTVAPVLSGTGQVGQTLSCTTGTWTNSPTSFTYQWLRDGSAISGATSATYLLLLADFTHDVSCEVTGVNALGSGVAAESDAITVDVPAPVNTVLPAITVGTEVPGATCTASAGTWTTSSVPSYAYEWLRCDADGGNAVIISGQTATTYVLTETDIDHAIRVRVTATDIFGSGQATSAATVPVHFPSQNIFISPLIGSTANTNWSTFSILSDAYFAALAISSGTQNDSIDLEFYAEAGTYTLDLLHRVSTNIGIYTLSIDGEVLGTDIDGYSSVGGGARGTITNVAISTTGVHTLRLLMATKNSAASSYFGKVSAVTLTRT